jgi:hypothetical protein
MKTNICISPATRYIEVDSTYRDRTLWPLPGEFEIPISQTGRKGRNNALDPVSLAAPILSFQSNAFDKTSIPSSTISATVSSIAPPNTIAGSNSSQTFTIVAPPGSLQTASNYYNHAIASNTTISEKKTIINYEYIGTDSLGNDRARIVVDPMFGNTFADGDTIIIKDPTDLSNPAFPLVFLPSGINGQNAYIEYLLYNETLNQYRKILKYDFITHVLTVDTSISGGGPVVGWLPTHFYSIRKEAPVLTGALVAVPTNESVVLSASASGISGEYNRFYIRFTSGPAINSISFISTYNGTTKTASVSPGFSIAPNPGDLFEILSFSYDNSVPFVYTGSIVSQQEDVNYEIDLLNIVLPNDTLKVGKGSRIAFYPYIYVEFRNTSGSSSGGKNIIYSNNPNSTRMLFRAVVSDTSNPITSSFIKLVAPGMKQTIKFKPNDNLYFSVRLPTGEVYQTVVDDTISPFEPNPAIQISAIFAIKRINCAPC